MDRFAFCLLFVFISARMASAKAPPIAHAPRSATTVKSAASAQSEVDDEDEDSDDDDGKPALAPGVAGSATDDEEDDDDEVDDTPDPREILANVALVSDYVLRGLSQTENEPTIQGGFDWRHPKGPFLGIWASGVRFPDLASSLEAAFYGGYRYAINDDLTVSLSATYLSYFPSDGLDSWDFPLHLEWRGFEAGLDFSPGWQGEGDSWYVSGGWSSEIVWGFTLGAFGGYSFFPQIDGENGNYADFRITAGHDFLGLNVEASGIFVTRREIEGNPVDPRGVLSVSKTF